jgi:hypothetical protein
LVESRRRRDARDARDAPHAATGAPAGRLPQAASHGASTAVLERGDLPHALLQHAAGRGGRDAPVPVALVPPNAAAAVVRGSDVPVPLVTAGEGPTR